MSVKLRVPGQKIDALVGARDEDVEKYFDEFQLVTRDAVQVAVEERGKAQAVEIPAAENDVVELEYADGTREWIAADKLAERLKSANRGLASGDTVYVSPQLAGVRTRSAGEWILKGLRVIGVDPAGQLADKGAAEIANYFESRQQPGPGLYYAQELFAWDANATENPSAAAPKAINSADELGSSDKPYLVLLHGTTSSTKASFGRLARSGDWQSLAQKYGKQILALDHTTLSASPVQNALDLACLLPPKARLHLLSHSRGGLVGELLARGPVHREALEVFKRPNRPDGEIETLIALSEELPKKQFRIERFVRVACPTRGTELASTRLDRYLSILLNLIGLIPSVDDSLIYPFAKATILALIHKKADPQDLPGLEAMMPSSPLVSFLNAAGVTSSTDLAVVAGDIEGRGILSTLGVLATDLYFQQDHDLVVNTDSMFKGVERDAGTYYSYEKGPDVSHFNYFANDTSRGRITNWLLGKDPEQAGFKRLEKFAEPVPDLSRELVRTAADDAPVVFVVPTVMGTYLRADGQRIWLNLESLAGGKLRQLAMGHEGSAPGAANGGKDRYEDTQHVVTDGIVAEGDAGRAPVARHEIIDRLRTLRATAEATPAECKEIRDQVDGLQRALREEWRCGSVWYALGEAYAAVGETKLAIDYLRRALTMTGETEAAPLQIIEQLAELEFRHAMELWRRQGTTPTAAAQPNGAVEDLFSLANLRLESALSMGRTTERLCLQGYYYQRHALTMKTDESKAKELSSAARSYYDAYLLAMQVDDPYPALDWVVCKYFASDKTQNGSAQQRKDMQSMVDSVRCWRAS